MKNINYGGDISNIIYDKELKQYLIIYSNQDYNDNQVSFFTNYYI